jgi:hypothetical protein
MLVLIKEVAGPNVSKRNKKEQGIEEKKKIINLR